MSNRTTKSARRAFDEATGLLKSRDFETADSLLNAALENHPNDPNLLRLRGLSHLKQDRPAQAEKHFTHAIRLVPDFVLAHENLAEALLRQGRLSDAISSLETALKLDPASASANRRLREIFALTGRGKESDELFRQSMDRDPDRQAIVEAMELNRAGETAKAERSFRNVLKRSPNNVDALRLMGVLCARRENFNDAEAFFRRAVEIAPDFWMAWMNLGAALNEQQDFEKAEIAYKRALEIKPHSVHALEKLGANCMNDGRLDDAMAWLNKALAIDKTHFPSWLCLGHALKTIGKQEEAIHAYRSCAAVKPDFGEVYWSLANLKTFRFEASEVDEMKKQIESFAKSSDEKDSEISFAFALGKAFEDQKEYKSAFEYYSRGNLKKRLNVNHDPITFQRMNDRIIDVFTRQFFEERKGFGCTDDAPILIVGLPRSGSTLLEQILASHSDVEGTAELHYLMRIATETGLNRLDGIKYPECMLELAAHHVEGLGQEYIEGTQRHRTGAKYFTDKMPNNFVAIGFLHTILPNAKVIDARRHPLDSCLGTFKQLFARGQTFSYDLYDIAHYYIQYQRMMEHWAEVLPGKVLTVHYEDVVSDLETQARRIAKHCGLKWEDQMLRFHETERAVKTASSEQVRRPIYAGSVHLWRRFEDELDELIEYLEPVLLDLPVDQRPKSLVDQPSAKL